MDQAVSTSTAKSQIKLSQGPSGAFRKTSPPRTACIAHVRHVSRLLQLAVAACRKFDITRPYSTSFDAKGWHVLGCQIVQRSARRAPCCRLMSGHREASSAGSVFMHATWSSGRHVSTPTSVTCKRATSPLPTRPRYKSPML